MSGWPRHYGIPNVYGSRFRRVTLTPESKRGGPAAAGQRAGGHVVCDAHIAGASRSIGAAQHPGRAAAPAASERAGA